MGNIYCEDLTDFETAIVLQTAIKCYSQVPNNIKSQTDS